MFIIHDETPERDYMHPEKGRGLDLSRRPVSGPAYAGVAEPFPTSLIVPRSEWQARIQEMTERKALLSVLCDLQGIKVKDQQRTNYCWVNAPTHCTEIVRALQNEPHVSLSPASVGARITHFRNVGGFGRDALEYIVANGIVPSSKWPDTAIDRSYDTADNEAAGQAYRIDEWWELDINNLDHLMSALLLGLPVSVGYAWWSHQVTAVDPVWLDGDAAIRIDNSWGTGWGDNGRGILQGRKMLPDDACCPRTALAG